MDLSESPSRRPPPCGAASAVSRRTPRRRAMFGRSPSVAREPGACGAGEALALGAVMAIRASSIRPRAFTSTNAMVSPRMTIRSISPPAAAVAARERAVALHHRETASAIHSARWPRRNVVRRRSSALFMRPSWRGPARAHRPRAWADRVRLRRGCRILDRVVSSAPLRACRRGPHRPPTACIAFVASPISTTISPFGGPSSANVAASSGRVPRRIVSNILVSSRATTACRSPSTSARPPAFRAGGAGLRTASACRG